MTAAINPEPVADLECHTGEGPLWHPDERCLYWVDIPQARLHRYDPAGGGTRTFDLGSAAGGFTLHADGRLLLFMADSAVRLWSESGMETVVPGLPDEQGNRFNDVIADPEGRVYCGVMSTGQRAGRLYRLDPDGRISVMLENTSTANGMGFSPDLRHFYFCDSGKRTITRFDYDRATGNLANARLLLAPPAAEGKPDGMTVDTDGCLWSARWDGWQLARLRSTGETLTRIRFPARNVSSVTFGGEDYSDLYVTTAGAEDRDANGPLAGALFRLTPGVRGRPEFRSRLQRSPRL